LERLHPEGFVTLDFRRPEERARRVAEFASRHPIAAAIPVDEDTAVAAAAIGEALGLPHNPFEAAKAARHKPTFRRRLAEAGLPSPRAWLFPLDSDPADAAKKAAYPCVLKPTFLSGSRGVIRADDPAAFVGAWRRLAGILREPEVAARGGEAAREIFVEEFVPGLEVALEGLLREGELETLAIFDKPDPLEGPYFEETLYVTPSRLPAEAQRAIGDAVARGAAALGLTEGAVHAELRWRDGRAFPIELAARSIGGLCSRALRFGTGLSLEELILRHALRLPVAPREEGASGVLMLPVPRAGVFEGVRGEDAARATPGIVEVTITARPGETLVPLPEGSRYPGFVFARGETPDAVERSLREAQGKLEFVTR
jgi:biotin carboxylase